MSQRNTTLAITTGLVLIVATSSLALTIHQKLNFDLVRSFPSCAGPGTCSALPLNEPGTAACATVGGTQQPYAFDDGQVQFRVSSGVLKVKILMHGVINGNGNTVNSATENWSVVAKLRRIGDYEPFTFPVPPDPLIVFGGTLPDTTQTVMTFPVQTGTANVEKTATIANPFGFSSVGVEVLEVSVLDPAGCVIAKDGIVIN